jgi:hypothetical protein
MNPTWNKRFALLPKKISERIIFTVYNLKKDKPEKIGKCASNK